MPSKATIEVIGHVGRDPEHKDVGPGLTTFSVATTTGVKRGDVWENKTSWWEVNCWGDYMAKKAERVTKGMLVSVSGPVEIEQWEGKDGAARSKVRISAKDILLLDKPSDGGRKPEPKQQVLPSHDTETDVPF